MRRFGSVCGTHPEWYVGYAIVLATISASGYAKSKMGTDGSGCILFQSALKLRLLRAQSYSPIGATCTQDSDSIKLSLI
jgi:hypothetical protein